ncbi:MAG: DnaB-like helicase C-terminal domain-containing protein [Oscillospiraceae bacterium]|nr:DnaB-like helicase C-terminal domain-containing protein [Oscillospiraceae bacterium]
MEVEHANRLSTGFGALDDCIGGIAHDDVIFLAARPGMGKTAFALDIAVHLAVKEAKRVAFFSLEESEERITARLRKRGFCPAAISDKTAPQGTGTIAVYDNLKLNIGTIKEIVAAAGGFDLFILDYFQQLSFSGKNKSTRIERAMMEIKAAATELHTPIMVLSQLPRSIERRKDRRPRVQDISCAAHITTYADILLFLYREAYYDWEADQTSALCFVEKSHSSVPKAVQMKWSSSADDGEFISKMKTQRPSAE